MGIFDTFTGDTAKKAAAENTTLFQGNQAMGNDALRGGQANATNALSTSAGFYGNLANKYGGATSLALDALGVNGAEGNQRATSAFQASPGYQWMVDQSLDGINRKAAATGSAATGNTLAALSDRAGNMANQEYQGWLGNLNSYVSPELQATGGQAGSYAAMAPVYTQTANSIANLGTTTANKIADQNTQAANAEMQGSGNLWNLGLNVASMAMGLPPMGSLMGGKGGGSSAVGNPTQIGSLY